MRRAVLFLFLSGGCLVAQPPDAVLQRYYQEGEKALAENRYAEAEQAYEKLRELAPGTAEVYAKLGIIYFQERKFEQAAPALRQALKLKPGLPNAGILLAMSLSELGRYSEALPGLEAGFRQTPDPALKRMAGLQLQRAYTGLRRDSKAVEVALELRRLYPRDPEVLYHAGRLFGNYAYQTMLQLSEVAPSSVWVLQAAGEAYESQGNNELAAAQYRQVLTLDPCRPGIHFRLGRVVRTEAITEFTHELQCDPTNANAAYELAEIHRKAAEFDKARELLEVALKYYPDFQEAQVGIGRVYIALRKPDQALPHLRKAIALNPEDEVPFYHLAQVYAALGNTAGQQKALEDFRRLRGQRSQQRDAVKNLLSPREVTKQEADLDAKP